MGAFAELERAWSAVEARFMASRPIRRLAEGTISVDHYAAYLRETYFYTREDPQIQAAATAWFRGKDRAMVKPFLDHASSEVGHDQLALNDLAALGFDPSSLPAENPLPNTTALFGFPFYAMQYRGVVSYLGYLFFLEFLPTSRGGDISAALKAMGVPAAALTFLEEHRSVDVHHNRLMRAYADTMLRTDADVSEVIYAMQVTGKLFEGMLEGAFEAVDLGLSSLVRIRQGAGAAA